MHSPEEKTDAVSEGEPRSPSSSDIEDLEVQRNRRVSLMASLSDGLPTLPAYVFELNTLLSTTPVDMRRVGEVIRTDPSLTAQVIRLSNSVLLGLRERVSSVEHALVLLGTERLRTLVLTCSLLEYAGQKLTTRDVQAFWQHCFLTATLSERLARGSSYPQPEQAYLSGLLHDVGTLPLLVICNSWKRPAESTCLEGWGESIKLERERFGTDHCEIGRWIGASWNFPPSLVEVFEYHHAPRVATHDPHLVGIVAAADQFCVRRGIVLGGQPPELDESTPEHNYELLLSCLPQLSPEDSKKLGGIMETDFLHLVQLLEFGAAGLFGGGIPTNPFREDEGQA